MLYQEFKINYLLSVWRNRSKWEGLIESKSE